MKNKIIMGFVILAFVLMFVTACANLESKSSETSETEDTSSLITGDTTKDIEVEDETEGDEEVVEEPEEKLVEVSITDTGFEPRELNLKVGDKVKWTNNRAEVKAMIIGVRELFDVKSGVLEPGESFTWQFDELGYFSYVDGIYTHLDGMIAVNK